MWAVVITLGVAAALLSIAVAEARPRYRGATLGWRVLALSALPLALGGAGFVLRFWEPTPGPYLANHVYPYGSHLNAWAVSFGFTWMAFGALFFAAVLYAAPAGGWPAWRALLAAWLLCWLPHGVIGIAFAIAGNNEPSVDEYRAWASDPAGARVIVTGSAILLLHFALAIGGFVATGRELRRALTERGREFRT